MTANLQMMTVKQAARVMNVSERSVYTARRVMREGWPELIANVEVGRISLHRAMELIESAAALREAAR